MIGSRLHLVLNLRLSKLNKNIHKPHRANSTKCSPELHLSPMDANLQTPAGNSSPLRDAASAQPPCTRRSRFPLSARKAGIRPNGRPRPSPQSRYLSARPTGGAPQRPIAKGEPARHAPQNFHPYSALFVPGIADCLGTRREGNKRAESVPGFQGTTILDSFLFFSSSKVSPFLAF